MIGDRENDIFQAFALRPAGTVVDVREEAPPAGEAPSTGGS